jgi:NADH-quinone oxidoreductase subunit A
VSDGETFLAAWVVFLSVAAGTVLLALTLGRFLRPRHPTSQKLEPYECGEEPFGSSRIQYDVRIYVATLLFLVFEIEVALFFPPAMLFGKLIRWQEGTIAPSEEAAIHRFVGAWKDYSERTSPPSCLKLLSSRRFSDPQAVASHSNPTPSQAERSNPELLPEDYQNPLRGWSWLIAAELAIFFGILLVAYAYLWAYGDLEWVRPPQKLSS